MVLLKLIVKRKWKCYKQIYIPIWCYLNMKYSREELERLNLHSNMVLLKPTLFTASQELSQIFTFQYGAT